MSGLRVLGSLVLCVWMVGCGNKAEGSGQAAASGSGQAAASGSGQAAASGSGQAAAPGAVSLRNAAGKLTKAGFDAAWKEAYSDMKTMSDPADKKAAAFEAKVGKPAKVEGDTKVWWAFDGDKCFKEELGKDGTKGDELVSADKCEK